MQSFLDTHGVLEVFQSGFKIFHSTESALLRVFNDLLISTDSDLTAAFDTVDHSILISRLEHAVGIKGTALEWFRSYLSDRDFKVSFGGSISPSVSLTCGVPQGSIIGPILFSLYLLPLGLILKRHNISFHLYADDLQIYLPIKRNYGNYLTRLVDCLNDIKDWMAVHFLNFNESKTEVMILRPSGTSDVSQIDLAILQPYVKSVITNLGVKMDCDFKMEKQINSVVKASFFQLRLLTKLKPFLSLTDFETVIHAFITTRLDYCNALYVGVSQASLSRLQLVQNSAARLLTETRKREHITPVLASLHWLPVNFRIDFKILLFVFKALHGLAPVYITSLLKPHAPSRSLRSANQSLLVVPKTRLKSRGDQAFSVAAPRLWNELPLHVRLAPSLLVFKSRLKTHFYSLAFNPA